MPHCGLRHSCCNARAAVRRARALELLESVHRPRMRAGLEVVPPTTGPGVVTLRKAQEFAERALGPRAPLGELKAAAVVRVRVPENLLAPREWRPPLRRAAGGAAQSAQHHQRCAQKPRVCSPRGEMSLVNLQEYLLSGGQKIRPGIFGAGRRHRPHEPPTRPFSAHVARPEQA